MVDYRRVFFDDAVGAFREDRPLEFFDGSSDREHYNPVRSFGVSESGQTLAATVCHAGYCEIEPVGGESGPSADTELRLWVSHNGGGTWEDQGPVLAQTSIIEVTDDDVLVRTRNIWRAREHWNWLTNEEWDAMLARLAPLGLDEREGWVQRFRSVASGETYPQLPQPTPPAVGRVDWRHIGERPDGAVSWASYWEYRHLLAIADPDGSPRSVYGAEEWLGGSFITNDLLIQSRTLIGTPFWIEATTMELVDLATASIHEVEGLSLPFGLDIESADSQHEYYRFITARPAPAAPARAAIEFTPLTRGEPRPLPEGLALYYLVWPCTQCDPGPSDLRRVFFDEAVDAFREDRPLAFFDGVNEQHYYPVAGFRVSESGQRLAAAICHVGRCGFAYEGAFPTADAELRLWVSHDGGRSWEDWGELLPQPRVVEVPDDDVLVRTRNIWHTREDWGELSDEAWESMLARLAALGLDELEGWEERTRWVVSGEEYSPPPEPAAPRLGDLDWWRLRDQPATGVAWAATAQDNYLLTIADREGSIERVYGARDWFAGGSFITDDLLINPVLPPVDGEPTQIATLELVDLASASIHEVKGLALPLGLDPAGGGQQREYYHFMIARPALVPQ